MATTRRTISSVLIGSFVLVLCGVSIHLYISLISDLFVHSVSFTILNHSSPHVLFIVNIAF